MKNSIIQRSLNTIIMKLLEENWQDVRYEITQSKAHHKAG
jgi:hypothetical protein